MSTDPVSEDESSSTQSWMDESKWAFIQENFGLVSRVAESWREKGGRHVPWDDLFQGAILLAAVCLRTWDPERGTFSTYYYNAANNPDRYMHKSIFSEYTQENGYNSVHSTDFRMVDDEDDSNAISRAMADDELPLEDQVIARDESRRLAIAVARLPEDLQSHALDILNERVDWSDVKVTADLHRRTLEALREEMA